MAHVKDLNLDMLRPERLTSNLNFMTKTLPLWYRFATKWHQKARVSVVSK